MTKAVEFPLKAAVMDMHGRLKVLEATAELQAAQLRELVGINRDLNRSRELQAREIHRLMREKDALLAAVGMQTVQRLVATRLEPKWGNR